MALEIISFGIAAIIGVMVTAFIIIIALGVARGIDEIFFKESRSFLKGYGEGWKERCGELKNDFKELSDNYTDLSEKFNENTIERLRLIEENEHWKSDVQKLAYDLGAADKEIQELKSNRFIREKTINILRLDLVDCNEKLNEQTEETRSKSKQIADLMRQLLREKLRLSLKYNPNVTRGKDGRYKSLKQKNIHNE